MGQVGVINQVSSSGGEYEIAKTIAKRFRQNRIEGGALEALSVGKRRETPLPAILIVRSQAAHAGGIRCYHTGSLFRAREIPAEFLSLWLE